ncbi:response regulator [Galbibacter orientalis]|mgnify:CR=1 FL=1|uniref:Response regulator containing a CheY-like receiver domain and an HTH DNA-binding domain n=1 Tax=Galbibacter orientalis DSM 19592 TaxID=926559 RepID=I3C194_9FLAO|nr:response regulator transcription factor [Galbibacter orientalis]EIJ37387.1 response regulator containing a CheY-like receiver domain and an HTH DNA-binding domain [Galbibacter orientalis DSM 19592]
MITHKVVIVEDYVLISQAMKELVNSFENFNVLYLCRNGKELVTKLKTPKNVPNIILMDVNMPIMDGIETTQYLKDNFPDIKVIALSVDENDETIIKMLKAGAKGYLLKDVEKQTLEYALEEVVKAGFYHTKSVTDILISSLNEENKKLPVLKEREIEFIKHVCTELTYKEIAEKMFLSPKTIDGYRDTLFEKLDVKNRIGLVVYAIKHQIFKV